VRNVENGHGSLTGPNDGPTFFSVQTKSLAETYSSKSDDELIALATDSDALLDEARPVLAEELRRRNITLRGAASAKPKTSRGRNTRAGRLFRVAGGFTLNLLIAVVGTTAVESPIWSAWSQIFRAQSMTTRDMREWLLSLAIAALLGFFIGKRRPSTAIWVWTMPVLFFGLGALVYSAKPSTSVLTDISFAEHFFHPNCFAKRFECRDFYIFTIPAVRTVAYSCGVWLWTQLHEHKLGGDDDPAKT
jgi:hypothetical protein